MSEGNPIEPISYHRGALVPVSALPVDAEWRNTVLRGLWLSAAATGVALARNFFFYYPQFAPNNAVAPRLGFAIEVAGSIASLLAIWWMTRPDPGARASLMVMLLRALAIINAAWFFWFPLIRDPAFFRTAGYAAISVFQSSSGLAVACLLFVYLLTLTRRMAAKRLETAVMIVFLGIVICDVFIGWLPAVTLFLYRMHWGKYRYTFGAASMVWYFFWAFEAGVVGVECAMAITLRRLIPISMARAVEP